MGTVVLLRLLDQVNFSQRAFVYQLLEPEILGCETQLLGIPQHDPSPLAGGDHPVAFREVQGHRLFHHHVLPRLGRAAGHLAMQVVGDPENHEVDVLEVEQVPIVSKMMGDRALRGETFGMAGRRRCHCDDLGARHTAQGFVVNESDEPGADQADPYLLHRGPVTVCGWHILRAPLGACGCEPALKLHSTVSA